MKKKISLVALSVFFLIGCTGLQDSFAPSTSTLAPVTLEPTKVTNDVPDMEETPRPTFLPQPGDSKLTRASAFPDSIDLFTAESDPAQIMLHISGYLPTPCHELRVKVKPPDKENNIHVEMYSVTDPEVLCAQVLRAFTVTIPLGSYPAGSYLVWVNGDPIGNFDS